VQGYSKNVEKKKPKRRTPSKALNEYFGKPHILICKECGTIWEAPQSIVCPECSSYKFRPAKKDEELDFLHSKLSEGFYNEGSRITSIG
jgi:rubrerythrin